VALGQPFDRVLFAARADAAWAYERLYRDLAPAVCGYLRLQGAREPEDLTSEVFLGAFHGLGTFAGNEAQFRSWVFTIAHRRLTDERRRVSHRPPVDDGHGFDGYGGDVEEDALRRMSAARVRDVCEALSPEQRDVLLLRMVSDMTIDAVAEALGKSPGAVKALQRRGLTTLREVLTTEGVPL
jgi:RNA polymerase sigma-70 factor (ECF subfamily)